MPTLHPEPNGPSPVLLEERLADPHGNLAQLRAEHWWAPNPTLGLIEVLEHGAARDLFVHPALGGHLAPFMLGLMESNPAICDALIAQQRELVGRAILDLEGSEALPRWLDRVLPQVTIERVDEHNILP